MTAFLRTSGENLKLFCYKTEQLNQTISCAMKLFDKQRFSVFKNCIITFPRSHVMVAGSLAVGLGVLLAAFPSDPVTAKRQEIPLAITLSESATTLEDVSSEELAPEELNHVWTTLTVQRGDN